MTATNMLAAAIVGVATMGVSQVSVGAEAPRGYSGQAASSVAGCPYLAWRLVRNADASVTGIAYYSDLSGLSTVRGTSNSAGQFQLMLTPSMGNGPSGTVLGRRTARGAVEADLHGQGCANMHLVMQPLTDVNQWTNSGGGGGRG